ncbi:MAG: RNA binding S1 domain protein [Candidatus Kaiserbacteria bacterium GW2011_GWB1_52_6]|uniref:RNA binding S1 domain protein n=3 Tax=Candidatus Kaiseribacteriota TaxID=1752734 RepID=A0A0G1ZSF4_9BACT|nr:MAG: RNA binding S1 domain protein [Candidatus Kaiserbacteria bacterium GW2011_GWA2_52_12]KKW28198.1 MAG: RNA binding S1 domain protein [Candidatus Kaiserbacteria bacterium GW2011_GWB1_52_6]KKW31167.1 MAG: RNA binding S1 domain protein [Candidatus Kaiserbacteria bacterium GW2011_GWC2_52_8b]
MAIETEGVKRLHDEEEEGAVVVAEKEGPMAELLKSAPKPPTTDDVVEGPVIAIGRACVFVDLHPFGTGIIFGREYLSARETLKNVNVGDTVTAKIIGTDNADGYIELSLREARQALIWGEAEMAVQKKSLFELAITDANKGGLIINWNGIQGFLPASQLAPAHYPRVPDGDKEKIFAELKRMVGQKLDVQIITANPKEQKLIFSEKGAGVSERTSLVEKYHVGDVVGGIVTGATEFGVFIKLEEGLEGLVHISEMDWALVENPKSRYKVGEAVKVKVIEIKDDKISLSIKALAEDPWKVAGTKYHKDQKVDAVVIKHNKHGALASIEEGVAGLVHISEFASEEELRSRLELGKVYPFIITFFEPKERRMTLKPAL